MLSSFLDGAVHALLVLPLLWYPGRFVLQRIAPAWWEQLDRVRRVAYAWPISLLVLALLAVPLRLAPVVEYGYPLVALWPLLGVRRDLMTRMKRSTLRQEARSLFAWLPLGLVFLHSVTTIFWTPIPGPLAAGYGDLASYYRVIANWTSNRPLIDFFIADYPGWKYMLPASFPLLTCASATLQAIVPSLTHAAALVSSLSGMLAVALMTRMITGAVPDGFKGILQRWLCVGTLLGVFESSFHLSLGAVTLPWMASAVVLVDVVLSSASTKATDVRLVVAAALATMILSRPEGTLCAAIALGLALLTWLVQRSDKAWKLVSLVVAVVASAWIVLTHIPSSVLESSTTAYMTYAPSQGVFRFASPYNDIEIEWWRLNLDHTRENLGLPRELTMRNPQISKEIAAHLGTFAWWVVTQMWRQLGTLISCLLGAALLVLLSSRVRNARLIAVCVCTTLIATTLSNSAFGIRHALPLLLCAWSAAWVILHNHPTRWVASSSNWIGMVVGLLLWWPAVLGAGHARYARSHDTTVKYSTLFPILQRYVKPGDVVATNYPQMVSFGANVTSVGATDIFKVAQPIAARFRPKLFIVDALRADQPGAYRWFKHHRASGIDPVPGYRTLFDAPAAEFVILEACPGTFADPKNAKLRPCDSPPRANRKASL